MAPPTPDLHGINPVFLSSNPSRWSVEEVYEFIASLQGEVKILSCTPVIQSRGEICWLSFWKESGVSGA